MKVKNLNHSSVKTKNLIRNTFAELIKEHKELSKVTVSELVKIADINRGTFYNHYDSIYDVAEELEAEIISVLLKDTKKLNSLEDIFEYLDKVKAYLEENEDLYRLLLSSKEPQLFLEKLTRLILEKIYNSINGNTNFRISNSLKFDISYFTDGIISQILKYFNGTTEYNLDEICENSKRIFEMLFAKKNQEI